MVSAVNNDIIQMPKIMRQAKVVHETTTTVVDISTTFVEVVATTTGRVSDSVKHTFGALSFVGGLNVIFTIPSLINNVAKAIRASSIIDRIINAFRAAMDGFALWTTANVIINGLRCFGVIAAKALSWIPLVNIILFPLQFGTVGLDSLEISDLRKERDGLFSKIRPRGLAKYTVEDLTCGCKYIVANSERIRKTMQLSKNTDIQGRAEKLLERLTEANADINIMRESKEFLKILRTRINTQYNLKVAGLAARTAGVVVAGVSLFVPPNPFTWALAGVFGLAALVCFALEKVLLNKDPFSPTEDVWHAKVVHKVRQGFGEVTKAAERMSIRASNIREVNLQPVAVLV